MNTWKGVDHYWNPSRRADAFECVILGEGIIVLYCEELIKKLGAFRPGILSKDSFRRGFEELYSW